MGKRYTQLTLTATKSDLKKGNFGAVDTYAGSKRLPCELVPCADSIAPLFDELKDYAANDKVYYEGCLWRFTAAHPAGVWIGTDAEATDIAITYPTKQEELANKVSKELFENSTIDGDYEFTYKNIGNTGNLFNDNKSVLIDTTELDIKNVCLVGVPSGYRISISFYNFTNSWQFLGTLSYFGISDFRVWDLAIPLSYRSAKRIRIRFMSCDGYGNLTRRNLSTNGEAATLKSAISIKTITQASETKTELPDYEKIANSILDLAINESAVSSPTYESKLISTVTGNSYNSSNGYLMTTRLKKNVVISGIPKGINASIFEYRLNANESWTWKQCNGVFPISKTFIPSIGLASDTTHFYVVFRPCDNAGKYINRALTADEKTAISSGVTYTYIFSPKVKKENAKTKYLYRLDTLNQIQNGCVIGNDLWNSTSYDGVDEGKIFVIPKTHLDGRTEGESDITIKYHTLGHAGVCDYCEATDYVCGIKEIGGVNSLVLIPNPSDKNLFDENAEGAIVIDISALGNITTAHFGASPLEVYLNESGTNNSFLISLGVTGDDYDGSFTLVETYTCDTLNYQRQQRTLYDGKTIVLCGVTTASILVAPIVNGSKKMVVDKIVDMPMPSEDGFAIISAEPEGLFVLDGKVLFSAWQNTDKYLVIYSVE